MTEQEVALKILAGDIYAHWPDDGGIPGDPDEWPVGKLVMVRGFGSRSTYPDGTLIVWTKEKCWKVYANT